MDFTVQCQYERRVVVLILIEMIDNAFDIALRMSCFVVPVQQCNFRF